MCAGLHLENCPRGENWRNLDSKIRGGGGGGGGVGSGVCLNVCVCVCRFHTRF